MTASPSAPEHFSPSRGRELALDTVAKARVQVEFNRPADASGAADGEPDDEPDDEED